jgi:hypothetical protein
MHHPTTISTRRDEDDAAAAHLLAFEPVHDDNDPIVIFVVVVDCLIVFVIVLAVLRHYTMLRAANLEHTSTTALGSTPYRRRPQVLPSGKEDEDRTATEADATTAAESDNSSLSSLEMDR